MTTNLAAQSSTQVLSSQGLLGPLLRFHQAGCAKAVISSEAGGIFQAGIGGIRFLDAIGLKSFVLADCQPGIALSSWKPPSRPVCPYQNTAACAQSQQSARTGLINHNLIKGRPIHHLSHNITQPREGLPHHILIQSHGKGFFRQVQRSRGLGSFLRILLITAVFLHLCPTPSIMSSSAMAPNTTSAFCLPDLQTHIQVSTQCLHLGISDLKPPK